MVEVAGSASFGYVMPLRTGNYRGMGDLIAPPPQRLELTLAQRALVCERLAHCFLQLHSSGFCYQDVNFGNIFLEPDNFSFNEFSPESSSRSRSRMAGSR